VLQKPGDMLRRDVQQQHRELLPAITCSEVGDSASVVLESPRKLAQTVLSGQMAQLRLSNVRRLNRPVSASTEASAVRLQEGPMTGLGQSRSQQQRPAQGPGQGRYYGKAEHQGALLASGWQVTIADLPLSRCELGSCSRRGGHPKEVPENHRNPAADNLRRRWLRNTEPCIFGQVAEQDFQLSEY